MMFKCPIPHLLALLFAVAVCEQATASEPQARFKRVFSWGKLADEDTAGKLREIGVTDIRVSSREQLVLARKYGMTPYCGTFTPCGPHGQVMKPEEETHFAYINGLDLEQMVPAGRKAEIDKRRLEKSHRYGGEPVAEIDTVNGIRIPCFSSDVGYALSKKTIDAICARVDGVQGIFFDYFGYSNFKGCYCANCLAAYMSHLAEKSLTDTEERRNEFYRDRLVAYCNDMIDYVKSRHPDFRVVIHVYPTFLPDPLYGNKLKADFCGQTVAWYFPWDAEKISRYTAVTVTDQNKHFKDVKGVPFLGLNRAPGSLWVKDAEVIDRELRTILAAGGDMLMVCDGDDMLQPGIDAVFMRHCGVGNNGSNPGSPDE